MSVENETVTYIIHFDNDPAKGRLALERARQIAFASFDSESGETALVGHELEELLPGLDVEAAVDVVLVLAHAVGCLAFGTALHGEDDDRDEGELRRLARIGLTALFDKLEAGIAGD
jgi:hypothetical protein